MKSLKYHAHSFLFCLLLLVLISGCATPMVIGLKKQPEHYTPVANGTKGVIYVYREADFCGSFRGIFITVDGKRAGGVNSGTYFVFETDPRKVVVSCENWLGEDPARTINVESGKNYYLKVDIKTGFLDLIPRITIVSNEEGEQAVKECKYAILAESQSK